MTQPLLIQAINALFVFHRFTTQKRCPYCQKDFSLIRIARPFLVKKLSWLTTTCTYRCLACLKIFTKVGNSSE